MASERIEPVSSSAPIRCRKISRAEELFNVADGFHPAEKLLAAAKNYGKEVEDLEFALYMDEQDPIRHLRNEFFYPKMKDLVTSKYGRTISSFSFSFFFFFFFWSFCFCFGYLMSVFFSKGKFIISLLVFSLQRI
jgi:hypothetical protein